MTRRTRLVRVLAVGIAVVLISGGGGVLWLKRQVDPGKPGDAVSVEVPRGSSSEQIAAILDDEGIVGSARLFSIYVRVKGKGPFQAGSYVLPKDGSFGDIVTTLEAGPKTQSRRLTIPEGLVVSQVAERVAQLPGRSAPRFSEVARSGSVRSRYQPPESTNLEGLLFPDTYEVDEGEDERAILERMVTAFDAAAARAGIDEVAEGGLVSPYQAAIVASLVEREARVPDDRGMIARVIYNRLRRGMPLQVDATVIYALGRSGERGVRVLNRDLTVASPYNTYRVSGLPPTPIAAPGRAALEAAVSPPDGPWLYYVVVEASGKHAFANTLAEHNANIALAESRGLR